MSQEYKKNGFKGSQYEIRLALYCVVDAIRKNCKFRLACNLSEANGWDDVVFQNGDAYWFIQTKCKNDTITQDKILNEDGDFSMVRYFLAFQEFCNSKKFTASQSKFVLFTTCSLANVGKDLVEESSLQVVPHHKCFRFTPNMVQPLCSKMKHFETVKMARHLVHCLFEGKCFGDDKQGSFKPYYPMLTQCVIDVGQPSNATFHQQFLDGERLEPATMTFRKCMVEALKDRMDVCKLNKYLLDNRIHLVVTKGFSKVKEDDSEWPPQDMDELNQLAGTIVQCLENRQQLSLSNSLLQKYQRVLLRCVVNVDQTIADKRWNAPSKSLFHFSFLQDNAELCGEIQTFKKIFVNLVKEKASSKKYTPTFHKEFAFCKLNRYVNHGTLTLLTTPSIGRAAKGSVSWPENLYDPEEVKQFFDSLILAPGQPNEVELKELTLRDIQRTTPFSTRSAGDIYDTLENCFTEWYKTPVGTWLNEETSRKWFASAADLHICMVAPFACEVIDKMSWADLKEDVRRHLLDREVLFQGVRVKFRQLLDDETAKSVLSGDFIHKLTRNDQLICIGQRIVDSVGYDRRFYTERNIQWPTLKAESCDKLNAFSNCHDFKKCSGNAVLLQKHEDAVLVLKVKGSLDDKHLGEPKGFPEMKILKNVMGVAILADVPGAGKSTTLSHFCHLFKKIKTSIWVIRIDLGDVDVSKHLLKFTKGNAIKVLLGLLTNEDNPVERALLGNRLRQSGDVVILFDGFDEISDKFQLKIISLVKELATFEVSQLWISTRTSEKKKLEKEFEQLALSIEPFTKEDQVNFVIKCWNRRRQTPIFPFEERAMHSKAQQLCNLLATSLTDAEKQLAGTLLQCQMAAEIFDSKKRLPDRIHLIELYDSFWQRKFDVFQQSNQLVSQLQNVAIRTTLDDYPQLWTEYANQPVDSMTMGDEPRFIHHTHAEYFTARYLVDHLCDEHVVRCLVESVLMDDRFCTIRNFVNRLLAKQNMNSLRTVETANLILSKLEKILKETRVAASEGHESIIHWIYKNLEMIKNAPEVNITQLLTCRNLEEKTPLHLAAQKGHQSVIDVLLKIAQMEHVSNEVLDHMFGPAIYGRTPVHLAARRGHTKVVIGLMKFALDNGVSPTVYLRVDEYGETPVHLAARWQEFDIVKSILKFVESNGIDSEQHFRPCCHGCSPIHWAAKANCAQDVAFLLEFIANNGIDPKIPLCPDRTGKTPAHYAAKSVDMIKLILAFALKNKIDMRPLGADKTPLQRDQVDIRTEVTAAVNS